MGMRLGSPRAKIRSPSRSGWRPGSRKDRLECGARERREHDPRQLVDNQVAQRQVVKVVGRTVFATTRKKQNGEHDRDRARRTPRAVDARRGENGDPVRAASTLLRRASPEQRANSLNVRGPVAAAERDSTRMSVRPTHTSSPDLVDWCPPDYEPPSPRTSAELGGPCRRTRRLLSLDPEDAAQLPPAGAGALRGTMLARQPAHPPLGVRKRRCRCLPPLRRRSGLTAPPPAACRCGAPSPPTTASAARSPSPAASTAQGPRAASR